ncbi:MAG TPA: hypothetical protein VF799_08385 [Geobacteraceae bacterium]
MAIMVQYKDKSFDYVPNYALDDLIAANSIIAFRRASGWAEIGRDPLRKKRPQKKYEGPERRALAVKMNCLTCYDFVDTICRTGSCPTRISRKLKYA